MRSKITRNPYGFGYLANDGTCHPSIAAAVRHTLARQPAPADLRTVPAPIVAPAPVSRTAPAGPDPFAVLMGLKRDLRHAEAELSAAPSVPTRPTTAEYRWAVSHHAKYASRVNRIKRQIATHRQRFGIPNPRPWKPRPAVPCDRRIARQYLPDATPVGWDVPRLAKPRPATASEIRAELARLAA